MRNITIIGSHCCELVAERVFDESLIIQIRWDRIFFDFVINDATQFFANNPNPQEQSIVRTTFVWLRFEGIDKIELEQRVKGRLSTEQYDRPSKNSSSRCISHCECKHAESKLKFTMVDTIGQSVRFEFDSLDLKERDASSISSRIYVDQVTGKPIDFYNPFEW